MTRVLLIRLAIFFLPIMVWLAWRRIAILAGWPVRVVPWAWLIAGGAVLTALSLLISAVLPGGSRGGVYVPGEAGADGRVSHARFAPRPPPPKGVPEYHP